MTFEMSLILAIGTYKFVIPESGRNWQANISTESVAKNSSDSKCLLLRLANNRSQEIARNSQIVAMLTK
jgi:hypothetical protein